MAKSESSDEYIKATELFSTYADSIDTESWIEEVTSFNPDTTVIEEDEFDQKCKTIYKSSKFFQKYNDFANDIPKSKGIVTSSFYNPSFVAIFLKKYVAYIPLWSQILTKMRSITTERANNGYIEGNSNLILRNSVVIMSFLFS